MRDFETERKSYERESLRQKLKRFRDCIKNLEKSSILPCYFSVITSAFTKVVIFSNGESGGGRGEGKGRMLKKTHC